MERRLFLKVCGMIGAGASVRVVADDGSAGNADPQAWAPHVQLRLEADGKVHLTMRRTEMGQGTRTAAAQMVAEELDVDMDQVVVHNGIPGGDFPPMFTGGSSSTGGEWRVLPAAAAAMRLMLVSAAAKRWSVEPESCRTESGQVILGDQRFPYQNLLVDVVGQPVPENPPLKKKNEYRVVGKGVGRVDNGDMVTGKAIYGLDVRVPEMRFAAVARCPVVTGKLVSFDSKKAEALPGVEKVFAIEGPRFPLRHFLFAGVAVVARDSWTAMRAASMLDIKWELGDDAGFNTEGLSRRFDEALAEPGNVFVDHGDVDAACSVADQVLEAVYEVPFLAHAPMEPMNTTAHFTKDGMDVWSPCQLQDETAKMMAAMAGLKPEQVHLRTPLLGGAFGRRLAADYAMEAALIAKQVSYPVQLMWSREDDMRFGMFRGASKHKMRGAIKEGKPTAWFHRQALVTPWHQREAEMLEEGLDFTALTEAKIFPYALPNQRMEQYLVGAPVPVLWWRGTFGNQNVMANECFIDELAIACGQEPLAFRLAHLSREKELVFQNKQGWGAVTMDPVRMRAVLEAAAKAADWYGEKKKGHGKGIACCLPAVGTSYVGMVSEVEIGANEKIHVKKVTCAIDCGVVINPDTVKAQVEGCVVYALSALFDQQITHQAGAVQQSNFHDFPCLRIDACPEIEVVFVDSGEDRVRGVGEPPVMTVIPSVLNAVYAASGKRYRKLPILT